MSARQIVAELERIRRALRTVAAGSVVLWTLAAFGALLAITTVARLTAGAPSPVFGWLLSIVAAMMTGAWRWRIARPDRLGAVDAALWVETQTPTLRYALVTLAERATTGDGDSVQQQLAQFASGTRWTNDVQIALRQRRLHLWARLLATCAVIAVAAYPWRAPSVQAAAPRIAVARGGTQSVVAGRVQADITLSPPAYTGRATRRLAFGETVSALVGSIIRIDAAGAVDQATLLVQESSDTGAGTPRIVTQLPRGDGWRGVVRVGASPIAVRLGDAIGERWLLITPVADSVPVATLLLPAADTLVFDTTARLRVSGSVHDDIALRDARVEYIISSGGGEQFTFKSGVLDERRGPLGRNITLATTLDLGALKLKPGDLMHVRLTAHDGNALSGPSRGSSETRTIRIPRADERASVAVEQMPPTPVDKSVLSQRQLLMLTERLVARMPGIERAVLLAESGRLGIDQARLRKQVGEIVFARLGDTPSGEHAHFAGDGHEHTATDLATPESPGSVLKAADRATGSVSGILDAHGDETPVVAVNRPLLEAYNAMWDATRALQGGTPREAVEPMRRAVAAIQRARSAERVYLRGTPPAAVIDLAKVRLIGTDSAKYEARRALAALPESERRIAVRVLRGMELLTVRDAGALDSLRLVRLDALASAPPLAAALGDLIDAAERGRDATASLLRVRRLAVAPWQRNAGAVLWTGGVP